MLRTLFVVAAVAPLEAHPTSGETFMVGACKLEAIGPGAVRSVVDARTVVLDDGRQVRLAGIETGGTGQETEELGAMLAGHPVVLRRVGPAEDRYGRLLAQLFIGAGATERWVQADLVARGRARVAARVGDRACARELLLREQAARDAGLGVWSEPDADIKRAEDSEALAAAQGRFVIIEGHVLSVRTSGNTIFINFGRRWTRDFAVTIAKRRERLFTAAGLPPTALAGRGVRVRGFLEQRGGPWIDATQPEQIELLERN